ncbi:MAG: glycosyltransferase [candidate division SR1 bacterium]|nr:glycosyltransferase [candidate division SR1 bacterium]
MKLSIIIDCLQSQTFKDFEAIFVVDKHLTEIGEFVSKDARISFISNLNSIFRSKRDANDPKIGGNASQLRNYGIKAAKGEFILLLDDDNLFDNDYLEKYFQFRDIHRKHIGKDFVLCPTLMYRKTGQVQNYGFSHFNYWMSRPEAAKMGDKERINVQMFSGNSLLAPAYLFKEHLFDERLDFVAEDLDFTRGISSAGIPIIVLRDLHNYHMESDKDTLQQARVGNEYAAYRKAKHRRIFVKKYASWTDKIKFALLGIWGQSGRLGLKVLLFGKGRPRWKIIWAIIKGTFCKI